MPKSRPPYPPELRRQLVEMVRAGKGPVELAEQFEPSEQCMGSARLGPPPREIPVGI